MEKHHAHKNAKNILMFTNYRSSNGQYVAELSHFKQLKIRLLNTRYELLEEGNINRKRAGTK